MVPAEALRGRGIFAGVPDGKLERFARIGEPIVVKAGEFLFRLGDSAKWLYLIDRGKVDLSVPFHIQGAPREIAIQTAGSGDTLAWSSLVRPHVLTMSARAVENSRLLRFSGEALGSLCHEEAETGLAVIERLTEVVGRRLQQVQAMWIRELQRSIDGSEG